MAKLSFHYQLGNPGRYSTWFLGGPVESSSFGSLVGKEHTFTISQFAGSRVLEQLNWFSAFGFHKVANC